MADEARSPLPIPQEQLQQISQQVLEGMRGDFEALLKASARIPPATPTIHPPVVFDKLDEHQMDRLKKELLLEAKDFVRSEIDEFLPADEIEARIRRGAEGVSGQFDRLKADLLRDLRAVVHDEVAGLRTEVFRIFDDLDMPLEEGEKRKSTRNKLAGLFGMLATSKEWKIEFIKSLRTSLIGWLFGLIGVALAAFNWPRSGGTPH